MPCRDYDFDYQQWLQRVQEHFAELNELLRQLCKAATEQSIDLPPATAKWLAEPIAKDAPLTKEVFDNLAQMLCELCELFEQKSLALPPDVGRWWDKHKTRDSLEAELERGLASTPTSASFWDEHAEMLQRFAQIPDIPRDDAIRALEKAGYHGHRRGKSMVMSNGANEIILPPGDPVNPYAMARILVIAGIKEADFRELLRGIH